MARARKTTRTRVSYPARSARRRATVRKKRGTKAPGLDWGKVAMFGAGALILFMIFKPRKASAAVRISPRQVTEGLATGKSLDQVIDDLLEEGRRARQREVESLIAFPRFVRFQIGTAPEKCFDGKLAKNVDMSQCVRCEKDFGKDPDPNNPDFVFCFPGGFD